MLTFLNEDLPNILVGLAVLLLLGLSLGSMIASRRRVKRAGGCGGGCCGCPYSGSCASAPHDPDSDRDVRHR